MSNDTQRPISDDEVVALARAELEQSREGITHRAVAGPPSSSTSSIATPRDLPQQQPGITIDLGHRGIARLPDEVIDVIRAEIERLALSSNLLTTLPLRLTECTRLRYLNVRNNLLHEFPQAILRMTSLEILDVRGNKLRVVPKEIANLTSLKVLSLMHNQIEELPVCLGDMTSLQVLKLDENPIRFPPPDVLAVRESTPSQVTVNEKDTLIAAQVKRFMKQFASRDKKKAELERARIESDGNESGSESNLETPRPGRRVNGARFPVKPSISHLDGFNEKPESPGFPPPLPTRSHFRVQSQQSNFVSRRPPVAPLVLGNGNERNRSQSEGAGPNTLRAKRMGIYTNKTSDLGSVDELRRTSTHFRGFSQGYAVPNNSTANGMAGPATAVGYGDSGSVRSLANRPLSDVWEHRRGSTVPDIVVEAARNFLYAISQLKEPIYHMVNSLKPDRTKEGTQRKERFVRRCSSTYLHVRALGESLQRYDTLTEEDEEEALKLSQAICSFTLKCFDLLSTTILAIAENRDDIAHSANPRILRTFFCLQQGSLAEMRNACSVLGSGFQNNLPARTRSRNVTDNSVTVRAPSRGPLKVRRYQTQTSPPQRNGQYSVPRIVPLHGNESSRANTLTSISIAATPRSGDSYMPQSGATSRSNTLTSNFEDMDEDTMFERVYAKLRVACDSCREYLPQIARHLRSAYELLRRELDSEDRKLEVLASLIEKCDYVERLTYPLAKRLSQMQLKDMYARSQPDFWQQTVGLISAWGDLAAASMADGRSLGLLSPEVKQLMKPLHRAVKEASLAINDSPWAHLSSSTPVTAPSSRFNSLTSRSQPPKFAAKPTLTINSATTGPFTNSINTSVPSVASQYNNNGLGASGYITPVPATPLSAALGPAAQATVPNTPNQIPQPSQHPHQHTREPGSMNWVERADRYLNNTARRV